MPRRGGMELRASGSSSAHRMLIAKALRKSLLHRCLNVLTPFPILPPGAAVLLSVLVGYKRKSSHVKDLRLKVRRPGQAYAGAAACSIVTRPCKAQGLAAFCPVPLELRPKCVESFLVHVGPTLSSPVVQSSLQTGT